MVQAGEIGLKLLDTLHIKLSKAISYSNIQKATGKKLELQQGEVGNQVISS